MKGAIISCVIAIALIFCAYLYGRADGRNLERRDALEAAMKQVKVVREEDKKRLENQEKVANETKKQLDQALSDYRSANDTSVRLQQRITSLTKRFNDTSTAANCEAARNTGVLLADMFSRVDKRAGELAEYADRARIAGLSCEGQYDALNKK